MRFQKNKIYIKKLSKRVEKMDVNKEKKYL